MTVTVLYQTPQLTPAPSVKKTPVSGFSEAYLASHIQIPAVTAESSQSKSRRPIAALGKRNRHSMSTSTARGQGASDSTSGGNSPGDKRRNKLGYHRTSVACGHCRRRKIRCILAPGDAQNRCANCIRLKKECTFYPVDQQPQPESRNPLDVQARYDGDATSEGSSPSGQIEQQRGRHDGLHYPPLTMPSSQDAQTSQRRTGSYSPDDRASTYHSPPHPYDYARSPSTWESASVPASSTSEIFNSGWRPGESPITPSSAYSPYTPGLQQPSHPTWPSIASEPAPAPREDVSWAVPSRSMSYGTVEGVPLQTTYSYPHGPLAPRISEAYAPALTAASPATGVGRTNSIPLAGPSTSGQPTFSMPAWQPYPYARPATSSAEAYGHYYGAGYADASQMEEGRGGTYGPPGSNGTGSNGTGSNGTGSNGTESNGTYYPNGSQADR